MTTISPCEHCKGTGQAKWKGGQLDPKHEACPHCAGTGIKAVVSLQAERSKREQPDPEFVMHDDFGRPMYTFGLEYKMDGGTWSFHLWAYDFEDAERRVAAVRESANVYGQIFVRIPG